MGIASSIELRFKNIDNAIFRTFLEQAELTALNRQG
jgi:hypothetical protein